MDDAEAVRRIPDIEAVVPLIAGTARVEGGERARSVLIVGVTSGVPAVFNFQVRQGSFIPEGDPRAGSTVAVLAPKLKRELFGEANALGEHVRVGGRRFRVIGVMEPKGELLGFDLDDRVYIPVSQAQTLFNSDGLWEIDVKFALGARTENVVSEIRRTLKERHRGEEDFTITTQTEMLDVFGRVLGIVSVAVSGIAAISLVVGAIGILTMMWIGVNERTPEIGLALAIGASAVSSLRGAKPLNLGGAAGVLIGVGIARHGSSPAAGAPPVRRRPSAIVRRRPVSAWASSAAFSAPGAPRLDPIDACTGSIVMWLP